MPPTALLAGVSEHSALLTDLYQLTMLQGYRDWALDEVAEFEFFVRKLPADRNFLVAAGLEQVLQYLERLSFAPQELAWLKGCGRLRPDFVDSLADFRFTGDADAMPEGTVFFADEPILRVRAPMREAQFVETRVINLLQFQCLIASKAARSVLAAPGKLLVDFGLRRAHGAEAGLLSARAAYLAGFGGTATVLAGALWGIPLYGTMAHSFVLAHTREAEAFAHFVASHPGNAVLLIDTYDTERAAAKVVALARELAPRGVAINAVRIDSGDLGAQARRVRGILDEGGCHGIGIFVSGNLDEYAVARLETARAPIDGYGIGTRMNTSADQPYLDCAYKLQAYAGVPRRKRSTGKATWPGAKQVYRRVDANDTPAGDLLTLASSAADGQALLQPVMRGGRRVAPAPSLAAVRAHATRGIAALPAALRTLAAAVPYPVEVAAPLAALASAVDARQRETDP